MGEQAGQVWRNWLLGPRVARQGLGAGALALSLLLAVTGACGETPPEREEVYFRGTRGPYRGRVVDAQAKQPIAGAVVVAVWYYDEPAVVDNVTQFHDALEVLTDAQGYFVVDAPDIERRAPRRTRFPVFTVFKPGYEYFRGWFAPVEEMADRAKRPLLGVVELAPNVGKGRRARLRNSPDIPLHIPREKIPNLLRALDEETEGLRREP